MDAIFDTLVVAGLEMQAVIIAAGSPIAADRASSPTKKMATAMGEAPCRAILSISLSGMAAAIRLKKSRLR